MSRGEWTERRTVLGLFFEALQKPIQSACPPIVPVQTLQMNFLSAVWLQTQSCRRGRDHQSCSFPLIHTNTAADEPSLSENSFLKTWPKPFCWHQQSQRECAQLVYILIRCENQFSQTSGWKYCRFTCDWSRYGDKKLQWSSSRCSPVKLTGCTSQVFCLRSVLVVRSLPWHTAACRFMEDWNCQNQTKKKKITIINWFEKYVIKSTKDHT